MHSLGYRIDLWDRPIKKNNSIFIGYLNLSKTGQAT